MKRQGILRQLFLSLSDNDLTGAVIEIQILRSKYSLEPVHRVCNLSFDFDSHYVCGMFFL